MVGHICREARIKKGISLRQAAREMGYSAQALSNFERGVVEHVHLDMLQWYAENTDAFGEGRYLFI